MMKRRIWLKDAWSKNKSICKYLLKKKKKKKNNRKEKTWKHNLLKKNNI